MQVEYISVNDIKPYEKNAKKHPEQQIEYIANSIKEFGWQQPIVIDKDNVIVIGHGRLLAAKKLGLSEVPIVRAEGLTETQIKALRIADNKTNESSWDNELLTVDLKEIFQEIDMTDLGFGDFELKSLTEDFEPENFDEDLLKEFEEHSNQFLKKKRVMITFTEEQEQAVCDFLGVEKLKVVYDFAELKK